MTKSMNNGIISSAVAIGLAGSAQGAVTLAFNAAFFGGVNSNFADASGVPSNDLSYGVVVDGNGDGWLSGYGGVIPSLNAAVELADLRGNPTDDVLYLAGDLTQDTSFMLEDDLETPGGVGGILGVAFNYVGTTSPGDAYGIVWFDGQSAGLLTDPEFVIPGDGSIVTHATVFEGPDPIRPATGLTFGVSIVPEPGIAMLGGLGLIALLRRRR